MTGPGISIKLSALHPRYSRAQADRVMGRTAAAREALALLAKSMTSASTSMPRKPIGWSYRSICWRASRLIRISWAGTASASWCRPMASAAPSCSTGSSISPAAPAGASWCGWSRAPTGTPRSSARRSTAWKAFPVYHPQDPHGRRLYRLRPQAA